MPADSVPFIIAVLLFFATFMVVVGGVSIWTYLPRRKPTAVKARAAHPDFARPAT